MQRWPIPTRTDRFHADSLAGSSPVLATVAALLMIPIILFTAAGFQVPLTLVLAPVAGLSVFRAPAVLRNLYLACLVAGLISIALASVVLGDPFRPRYLLSLLLIMTPPLYFFLGRDLCARYVEFRRLLETLGGVATVFVLALALKAIVTGSQIRWYIGEVGNEYTVLNVDFLGLPIYGSFGVLSLVSLLVLQTFVIAAAFIASAVPWRQVVLLVGFAAATLLVFGSNARGPLLVLPCLLALLSVAALLDRGAVRRQAAILVAVGLVAMAYSSSRMIEPNRLMVTVRTLLRLPPDADIKTVASRGRAAAIATPDRRRDHTPINYDKLSTGRESLLQDSLREVAASPVVGNGFASFGRVDPQISARSLPSRTTHVHYLTILWKGGVMFFLPYMALLGAFWLRAIRGTRSGLRPERIFVCAGVVFLFTILSLTWDILLVPSAGALGFFLLGALSESDTLVPRNESADGSGE